MKQTILLYIISACLTGALTNLYVKVYTDKNDTQTLKDTTQALSYQITEVNQTTTQGFSLSFQEKQAIALISVQGFNFFNGFIYNDNVADTNISNFFPVSVTDTCNCTDTLYYTAETICLSCFATIYVSSDFKNICVNSTNGLYGCAHLTRDCTLITGTVLVLEGIEWVKNIVTVFRNFLINC